jgi:hypothetical protein
VAPEVLDEQRTQLGLVVDDEQVGGRCGLVHLVSLRR